MTRPAQKCDQVGDRENNPSSATYTLPSVPMCLDPCGQMLARFPFAAMPSDTNARVPDQALQTRLLRGMLSAYYSRWSGARAHSMAELHAWLSPLPLARFLCVSSGRSAEACRAQRVLQVDLRYCDTGAARCSDRFLKSLRQVFAQRGEKNVRQTRF